MGKNALKLELPEHFKIHPVVHVVHTAPYFSQPQDIGHPIPQRPTPVPTPTGEEYEVDKTLSYRKRGRDFQFLTLMKGSSTHDAMWQPTRDFVDPDGTTTLSLSI